MRTTRTALSRFRKGTACAVLVGIAASATANAAPEEPSDAIETITQMVPDIASESQSSETEIFDLALAVDVGGATVRLDVEDQPADDHDAGMTAFSETHTSTDFVVQQTSGGERMMHVIRSSQAPTAFTYDLTLDEGHSASIEDGFVTIRNANGSMTGMIDRPWAYDASGSEVPTSYRLADDQLILEVAHGASNEYPIVADPWIPAWAIWACGAGFLIGYGSAWGANISVWTMIRSGVWGCIGGLLLRR